MKRVEADVAKARTKDSMHAFEKLTRIVDGEPRIISDPPLIVPIAELIPAGAERDAFLDEIRTLLRGYRRTLATDRRHLLEQFRFVDLARKVVGVGSVGTRAWIALFSGTDDQDPLFLQVKEAQPSVLEQFTGKSEYGNCGQRVGSALRRTISSKFVLPTSSSPSTIQRTPIGSSPSSSRKARITASRTASSPLLSAVPRANSLPSRRVGSNGGESHNSKGSTG